MLGYSAPAETAEAAAEQTPDSPSSHQPLDRALQDTPRTGDDHPDNIPAVEEIQNSQGQESVPENVLDSQGQNPEQQQDVEQIPEPSREDQAQE